MQTAHVNLLLAKQSPIPTLLATGYDVGMLRPDTEALETPSRAAGHLLVHYGNIEAANGQRPTANGQRPTANGQRPTANGQRLELAGSGGVAGGPE